MSEPALVVSALTVFPVKSFAGTADDVDGASRSPARAATAGGWSSTSDGVDAHRAQPPAHARRPGDAVRRRGAPPWPTACRRSTWREPSGPPDVPVQLSRLDTATRAGDEADAWCSELARAVASAWSGSTTPRAAGWRRRTAGRWRTRSPSPTPDRCTSRRRRRSRRLDAWAAELHDERVARALETGRPGARAPHGRSTCDGSAPTWWSTATSSRSSRTAGPTLVVGRRRAAVRRPLRAVRADDDRPGHAGQGQGAAARRWRGTGAATARSGSGSRWCRCAAASVTVGDRVRTSDR